MYFFERLGTSKVSVATTVLPTNAFYIQSPRLQTARSSFIAFRRSSIHSGFA